MQTLVPALTAYGAYLVDRAARAADAGERAATLGTAGEVLEDARQRSEAAGMAADHRTVMAARARLEEESGG